MEKKIVSISSKRQITIPQKYFTALGFTDEADAVAEGRGEYFTYDDVSDRYS